MIFIAILAPYLKRMYEFIEGKVEKVKPAFIIINANGVGYYIHISLATFDLIKTKNPVRIFTHQIIKEDSHSLFGFATEDERQTFIQLISVSGIGANTARLILSSLKTTDLVTAILNGNAPLISSIKGIGPKTAQRMILELKDKVGKINMTDFGGSQLGAGNNASEALQALISLGFNKQVAEKAIQKSISIVSNDNSTIEQLIKNSLKLL